MSITVSTPNHFSLNPFALEYYPSTFTYYVFFVPQFYPLTLCNINNYHQTHLYHPLSTPQPLPPQTLNQKIVQSLHQRGRFGRACSKNRGFRKRVELEEKQNDFYKFEREEMGTCRVVKKCVMFDKRPKPVMHLRYGEENLNITTVMIRNVPNKLTRNGLLTILDKHCMLMNEVRKDFTDEDFSAYDFVYLPIDFKNEVNKGYAFVNFTNKRAVKKFYNVFHNKPWDGFITPKICEIVCAKIQGKEELVKHFGGTLFICRYDEYLPVCFSPARDGSGKAVEQVLVGKRSSQNITQEKNQKVWEGMQWKRLETELQKSF